MDGFTYARELEKMFRAELHSAQELNRELAKVLWALRDEMALWRTIVRPRQTEPLPEQIKRKVIVPNGTRPIVRLSA